MKLQKNTLLILLFIIVLFGNNPAYSDTTDSLLQRLSSAKGIERMNILNDLTLKNLTVNPEKSTDYAEQMLLYAKSVQHDSMVTRAYYALGLSYYFREYWNLAAENFVNAIEYNPDEVSELFKAQCSNNAGICFDFLGEYEKAASFYFKTIAVGEKLADTLLTARARLNLGMIYVHMQDMDKAAEMFRLSLPVFIKFNDTGNIINAYENLFITEGEIGNRDTARNYFNKALSMAVRENDSLKIYSIEMDYGNLLQNRYKDYRGAKQCFNSALRYVDTVSNAASYYYILYQIGNNEMYLGNLDKAEKLMLSAHRNLERMNLKTWVRSIEYSLSRLYAQKGDFTLSDNYQEKAKKHDNELFEEKKINSISEMEVKYKTRKKEQEVEVKNIQIASQKKQLILISILAFVFASALVVVLWMTRKIKMVNHNLFERNRELTDRWEKLKNHKTPSNNKDSKLFNQIAELMNLELLYKNPKLTVDYVSKRVNANSKYVSQAIREKTGMNFNNYVNTYRIEEAKKILLDDESKSWSLDAVAVNCGFNNPTTFYQSFKKYTGLTPASFRNIK